MPVTGLKDAPGSRKEEDDVAIVKLAVWVIALVVLVGSAGCGGSDSNGSGETADKDETTQRSPEVVGFSHSYFSPPELTISAGDTVIFNNLETMSHPLVNEELGLDTGEFTQGKRSVIFDRPGTFTITNTAHGTTITVVVQGGWS
jgi:plastocyanin